MHAVDLVQNLVTSIFTFEAIALYCEFGERVTNRFDDIDNAITDLDWHFMSHKIQKVLPIVLMATQEPVIVIGFGNISFTRETFKKVFF